MRTNLRIEAIQWALIGAMFVLAAVVWPSAPDQIPVHWGLSGEPDRYGGKIEGLLLLPLVTLGVYFAMLLLPTAVLITTERVRNRSGRTNHARPLA